MGETLRRLSGLKTVLSGNNLVMLNYVLERPAEVALMDAAEFGRRVGVSASTVVRFAKRVGFSGYPEFRRELRRILQAQIVPMKKLRQSIQDAGEEQVLAGRVIEMGAESLRGIYNASLEQAFSSATEAICSASRLFIVGMRSSFAVAYYLSFMLAQFMPNVSLVSSGTEDAYDRLVDIDSGDVFFAVSFPRYTRRTADMAAYAKRAGARVISLTDTMASVLVPVSDIVLLAPNLSPFYSFIAPMAVADALIVAVGKRFKDRAAIALDKREKALIENGIYV